MSSGRAATSDGGGAGGPDLPLTSLLITCGRAAVLGLLWRGTDLDVFLSPSPLYSSCATGASLTSFPMDLMAAQSFWKNVSRFVLSELDLLNAFHVALRGQGLVLLGEGEGEANLACVLGAVRCPRLCGHRVCGHKAEALAWLGCRVLRCFLQPWGLGDSWDQE